jgi:hypothetical protein
VIYVAGGRNRLIIISYASPLCLRDVPLAGLRSASVCAARGWACIFWWWPRWRLRRPQRFQRRRT